MPPTSHDQNFKNLILDYPREALAFFAAEEAQGIDASARITPIRQEQLKGRLGDRFHELDVPLLVEWPDGRREALLFVLEEESDPSRFSIHRLVSYCVTLSELFETDRVVPVVIFLRSNARVPKRLRLGGDRHTYLQFDYVSCVLSETPAEAYLESDNLVARLNLPNMRWSRDRKIEIYAQAVRGLLNLEPDIEKRLKYMDFVDIYSGLDDNERRLYEARYPQESEKMAGLTERLLTEGRQQGMQQGLQQGLQQGMQKGLQQGERQALARQLARRFGRLDAATERRLEAAGTAELERWLENILDARTLDEVFDPR